MFVIIFPNKSRGVFETDPDRGLEQLTSIVLSAQAYNFSGAQTFELHEVDSSNKFVRVVHSITITPDDNYTSSRDILEDQE